MIEYIELLLIRQRQDLNNGTDYQDATEILDLVEQAGMMPPDGTNHNDPDLDGCYPCYAWERE